MYRTQCVGVLTLYVGLAHSWDIAVSLGDELVLYTNGSKTDTVSFKSHNLTALAYDEVHNMMLYVDKQSDYDAVCGYNLRSMENKCFIKRVGGNIQSIAFDPTTDTLFFTDTNERSINWISLKPGFNNNVYGNLLIKMEFGIPGEIAVDSCRGYIYWINNITLIDNMERARFNGSERKVIYQSLRIFSLAMEPQTREIYYFDGFVTKGLNRADFDVQNQNPLFRDIYNSEPKELTVSNDYIYWMNSSVGYKTVWQIPKNAMRGVEPKEMSKLYTKSPLAMAANYKSKSQIQGCEALSSLVPKITVTRNSLNIQRTTECTTVAELFCVHGIKVNGTSVCKCTPGYIGERCDVSDCENYCLQGNCSFNDEGLPTCRCNAGYSGERCEVYACHDYCLNNGDCSLNEKDEPVCHCVDNYDGKRCEAVKDVTFSFTNTPTYYSAKRNLTLADLLSTWRKPTAKISVVVEV